MSFKWWTSFNVLTRIDYVRNDRLNPRWDVDWSTSRGNLLKSQAYLMVLCLKFWMMNLFWKYLKMDVAFVHSGIRTQSCGVSSQSWRVSTSVYNRWRLIHSPLPSRDKTTNITVIYCKRTGETIVCFDGLTKIFLLGRKM